MAAFLEMCFIDVELPAVHIYIFHFSVLHTTSGDISENYKEICTEEQKVSSTNPGNKSAFQSMAETIRSNCIKFNNEASAIKCLMPKVKAAAKGKAAANKPTKEEEDLE